MAWQVQEAKQRFSELLRRAITDGPQVVTRHGEAVAVVVGAEDFRKLNQGSPDFKEFLLTGPDLDTLEIERSTKGARRVEL